MLLWLIVLAIFAILGLTGYYKGAIRSLVALVGLIIATYLALPLAPLLKPLVPKVGLVHPVWAVVVPPVVVFLLIALIFIGLSFLVHQKVALHFKYATDDFTRLRWERLNQRLGLCVGLVGGAIYSILVALVIYIFGYPAVQVTSDDSPALQRFLSTARQDIRNVGLDKTLAAMDPMPSTYYQAADVLGLVYQNYAPSSSAWRITPPSSNWADGANSRKSPRTPPS
ncbi:MAG: CvpA family protein [Verrucomicrobia bacterium]|nr:CvpA family protein [Verrucomicrobiota bacterium]